MTKLGERLGYCARNAKDWIRDNWKEHVVDSTSLLTATHPIYIAFEVNGGKLLGWIPYLGLEDVSDDLSLAVRKRLTLASFGGLSLAFSKLINRSRRKRGITDKSPENVQTGHDMSFAVKFAAVTAPILYGISGADLREIAVGTAISAALAIPTGPIMKYAIGVGRDLVGLEKFERDSYPDLIRRRNPYVKKGIAAGLMGISVGLCGLVYSLTDSKFGDDYQKPVAGQVADSGMERNYDNMLERKLLNEGGNRFNYTGE